MPTLLRFTRRYMLPYLPSYAAGTLALIATSWLSVTVPFEVAAGVDAITAGAPGEVIQAHAWRIAAMGVAIIVIRTLSRVLYFTPGRQIEADLKRDLFAIILRHQPVTLRGYAAGDLFSRLTNDINMVRVYAGFGTLTVANVVVAIVMAGGQMLRTAPDLAVWLLVPVAVAFAAVQLLVRRLFVLIRRMQVEVAAISEEVLASIRGMATIQAFVAEDAFQARFDGRNEAYQGTSIQRSQLRALLGPTLTLSTSINLFLLLAVGGPMAVEGHITVGELVAFATLANYLTSPLRQSSFLISVVQQARAAMERIEVLLDTPPVRPELPSPATPPAAAPAISIRGLTWAYPGSDQPALIDVDLDLPAGATLGVFGTTGAGKTTLLRLLTRLDNPPPGTIFIDGTDLLQLDLDAWRRVASFASQRPFLFSETLGDNLGLGDPARVPRAVRLGALGPDLERLPEGLGTLVGESGVRLSGGQRQRAALARALVRPHTVTLLDDVLSAVDHGTEHELIDRLEELRAEERTTTVLVSHRVSALQRCDQVIVLHDGRVIDRGTPAELLARDGPIRDAWLAQQAAETGGAP